MFLLLLSYNFWKPFSLESFFNRLIVVCALHFFIYSFVLFDPMLHPSIFEYVLLELIFVVNVDTSSLPLFAPCTTGNFMCLMDPIYFNIINILLSY